MKTKLFLVLGLLFSINCTYGAQKLDHEKATLYHLNIAA